MSEPTDEAAAFEAGLEAVLARVVPGYERLDSVRRLSAGASQETYRIDLVVDGVVATLALRRAAGGIEATVEGYPGLVAEARMFEVARAAGVPEPEVVYVLDPADGLGPGFVMEWLEGETLGSRVLRDPALEEIRPRLAHECGRILARIHAIDVAETGLDQLLSEMSTRDFVELMWVRYRAYDTPQPMIDYTARWLLEHLPADDRHCLVHNDFRNGNLMITPEGVRAVLDWEVAHIGDPVRDLGWICTNSWRFGRSELPVGGFGTREDLLAGYEAESGIAIHPDHLHFWEVFGSYWWAIGCLGMAEAWRNGPDATVERPGIARRSSECQVDCSNLIIPGPVELVAPIEPPSSIDMPNIDELLTSVRDFLRNDVRDEVGGRSNFLALVASNSLEIVRRELQLAPECLRREQQRLAQLLDRQGDLDELRRALVAGLRDGSIDLDHPGLADHLRQTVVNQLAIDQPKYSGLARALGTTD